jgi:hypothetical protein
MQEVRNKIKVKTMQEVRNKIKVNIKGKSLENFLPKDNNVLSIKQDKFVEKR